MANPKSRKPIAAADIQRIFDDCCIQKLAEIAKLPPDADAKLFAEGIRDAARIYARDAAMPTDVELRNEIAALYRAAPRKRYEELAKLLEQLSPPARKLLNRPGGQLPVSEDLRDATGQEKACEAVLSLCQYGGAYVEGRLRPSGKRSRTWQTLLAAPAPSPYSAKRSAERAFVMWLQMAWRDATRELPGKGANAARIGPFARMVAESLRLVGAAHADAVGLLNKLNEGPP